MNSTKERQIEIGNRKLWQQVLFTFITWRGMLFLLHLVTLNFSKMRRGPQFYHVFPEIPFLDSFFRWDYYWYNTILENGYFYDPEQQSNVAFFPLYPLLIKFVTSITPLNRLLAGLLVSNLCLLVALYFVYKISLLYLRKKEAKRTLIFILIFPTSFFYSAFYTESLYLLTIAASFYYFLTNRYLLAGIWGFLASLTRVTGFLLLVSFAIELAIDYFRKTKTFKKEMLYLLLIPCGLIAYMLFLYVNFNEPLAFIKTQGHWGRSNNVFPLITLVRGIKYIGFFLSKNPIISIYFLEFTFTTLFLFISIFTPLKKRFSLSLVVFCLMSITLPLMTGTTFSMMRLLLPIFPAFMFLGYLSKNDNLYILIVFSFTYLLAVLFLWFAKWGWVG